MYVYRKAFAFKSTVNNSILFGLQLKFPRFLFKCLLPGNGWRIFSRLSNLKNSSTSFASLALRAMY